MPKRRSNSRLADDSSVAVPDSPVSLIKQKGNLTGNVRIVREHVFDIRDFIMKWNSEMVNGVKIISNIKSVMYKKLSSPKSEFTIYTKELQKFILELEKICEKMELIHEKLGQKSANMSSLNKLEERYDNCKPLFLTWPASKFAQVSKDLFEMFRREMELKTAIKEEICFCTDSNALEFLEIAWLQQPYIEKAVNLDFELMLKEVGHSPISSK